MKVVTEPEHNRLQKSTCTAAIDFGTSSISVAYITPLRPDAPQLLKLHSTFERVPNAILLRYDEHSKQCITEEIGRMAQEAYSKLGARNRGKFIYFERIKMLLERDKVSHYSLYEGFIITNVFSNQTIDRTTKVSSFTGGSYYLIEVIAFIIKRLKEMLLDELKGDYKSTDFDWVITVPAIWKARARRMMREAAYIVSSVIYYL